MTVIVERTVPDGSPVHITWVAFGIMVWGSGGFRSTTSRAGGSACRREVRCAVATRFFGLAPRGPTPGRRFDIDRGAGLIRGRRWAKHG